MIEKENEQMKTMLTKDRNRRNQDFQRGWTEKNILFTQKKKEMADLFFVWQKVLRKTQGIFFNCKVEQDYHCYYHFLVVFDVVL